MASANIIQGGLKRGIVQKTGGDELNRVQVLLVEENLNVLAFVLSNFASDKAGTVFVPSAGQEVLVGFLDGSLQQPVIIGSLPNAKSKPPVKVDDKNEIIHILFPGGMTVIISTKDDDQKVEIKTKNEHVILLDNQNEKLSIMNKGEKTGVLLDFKNGAIQIKAEKKIELLAGAQDSVVIEDGKGTGIESKSKDFVAKAMNVKLEAQTNAEIKANSQVKASGNAGAELSSSAMTTVKGNPINLN